MPVYRYSAPVPLEDAPGIPAGALLDQLFDDFTRHGDMDRAVRQLVQRGADDTDGGHLDGIQDLLRQLRDVRTELLERYDLASVWDSMKARLDAIIEQERAGIRTRLDTLRRRQRELSPDAAEGRADLDAHAQEAAGRLAALNALPEDAGGTVQTLHASPFLDDAAQAQFNELFAMLQRAALDTLTRSLEQAQDALTPDDLAGWEQFAAAVNAALDARAAGGEPDLSVIAAQFSEQLGGATPPSVDNLAEQLWRQAGRAPSLLASLPLEQHRALSAVLQTRVLPPALDMQMQQTAAHLRALFPNRLLGKQYAFRGSGAVSLHGALLLMEQLRRLDELERHLERTRYGGPLDEIDRSELEALVGKPAADTLDALEKLTEQLIEAGYLLRDGDALGLTARGMRRIGQKAMLDIFRQLRQNAFGNHPSGRRGFGVDMADATRPYEFGQPFFLHLERTLLRAAARGGGVPVRLQPSDFEVYGTEQLTSTATVLMLDLSRSMPMRGNAHAARKVALALHELISTQFPRDNLYVVGFSGIARAVRHEDLPKLDTDDFGRGTNMQAAFREGRRLLARHKGSARQIIMITDGEPTAYFERNGQVYLELPPSPRVLGATLAEVQRCTRDGIIINTFMLDRSEALRGFVQKLTRFNRGRVFFTSPDTLGQYLLVDYLAQKRVLIS